MTDTRLTTWTYPWDLLDEGMDHALDDIMDRAGTGNVAVASVYHAGRFLLPHNPRRKVYFPRSGTVYFRPDPGWYGKLAITPPRWSPVIEDDFWPHLAGEIHGRGGELTSWCLGLHSSGIGAEHPEYAVENAYGDSLTTDLCPSNGEVVEYLATVVANAATATTADRMLLESFEYMPFQHGFHHEVIGVPVPPRTALLMTLCFCARCRERAQDADIDVETVRAWVISEVEKHFDDPFRTAAKFSWSELRAECGGAIGEYLNRRAAAVTALITEVTSRIRACSSARIGLVDFGPLYTTGPDGSAWESGLDLAAIAPLVDELHPAFYLTDDDAHASSVDEYLRVAPPGTPIHGAIRAILPQVSSPASLESSLAPLQGRVDGLSFYNYGFMARQTMDWIRGAASGFRWQPR